MHLHAVTFATAHAQDMDRPVHIKAETTSLGVTERSWLATLYPPEEKRTLLSQQRILQVA